MNFTHLCRSSNGVLVPTAGVVQAPGSIVVPSDLLDPNLPWVPNQLTYASHYRPLRHRRTLVPASMHTLDIEDEVKELHKIFRKMGVSQKHYHDDSEALLQRQQSSLLTLNQDNSSVQFKLDCFYPEDFAGEMARATAEITLYQDKKAHEENRLKELQHCMAELTADELHANLVMGGPFAHRDLVKDTQLQEHMLQNRVAKALVDLTQVQHHNKQLEKELRELQEEHNMMSARISDTEHRLMDILIEKEDLMDVSYALYKERHDIQRLISDVLEMEEAQKDCERHKKYGCWIDTNGNLLADVIAQKENELQLSQSRRRSTLPLDNDADLKRWFAINERDINSPHYILEPYMENSVEVLAFTQLQRHLNVPFQNLDALLPALGAAKDNNRALHDEVEKLQKEVEALKPSTEEVDEEDEDLTKDVEINGHDVLKLVHSMSRQIFHVFLQAGITNLDPSALKTIEDGTIDDEETLEVSISTLFAQVEDFIEQLVICLSPLDLEDDYPSTSRRSASNVELELMVGKSETAHEIHVIVGSRDDVEDDWEEY